MSDPAPDPTPHRWHEALESIDKLVIGHLLGQARKALQRSVDSGKAFGDFGPEFLLAYTRRWIEPLDTMSPSSADAYFAAGVAAGRIMDLADLTNEDLPTLAARLMEDLRR